MLGEYSHSAKLPDDSSSNESVGQLFTSSSGLWIWIWLGTSGCPSSFLVLPLSRSSFRFIFARILQKSVMVMPESPICLLPLTLNSRSSTAHVHLVSDLGPDSVKSGIMKQLLWAWLPKSEQFDPDSSGYCICEILSIRGRTALWVLMSLCQTCVGWLNTFTISKSGYRCSICSNSEVFPEAMLPSTNILIGFVGVAIASGLH